MVLMKKTMMLKNCGSGAYDDDGDGDGRNERGGFVGEGWRGILLGFLRGGSIFTSQS